jgi:MYXO-CTERM domain-containing protein
MKQWLVRRGVLATVPVASLVLAFGACSSEHGAPTEGEQGTAANVAEGDTNGVELVASPNATARIARLSKQFIRMPVAYKEAPFIPPPGAQPPKPRPAEPLPEPRAVLSKGDAKAFVRQGSRLRAEVDALRKSVLIKPASIELPLKADGFVRVQPDGAKLGVEFATKGAKSNVEVEVADGIATYVGAGPHGSDLVFRVTGDSVEDFVVLSEKPAEPFVDYTINTSEVAGLRLIDNTLEFLDKGGDPQVRVKPPRVIDADGAAHEAFLSLLDCKADTNGEEPWGRPVTAPGSAACTMRVSWRDENVIYPAIVDPVWASAGSLATARYRNAAVRLSTGSVLTCGGINDLGIATASCESFNPAGGGGAGAWTTVTAMNIARTDFTLLLLSPSADVLAVGGNGLTSSERRVAAAWTTTGTDFAGGSFYPQMPALSSDGAWVVLLDAFNTPYRFNTATNVWSTGTPNPSPQVPYRYDSHTIAVPGQGTILRVGGYYNSIYQTGAERYKPSLDTAPPGTPAAWTNPGNAASMTVPRATAAVVQLDNNRVMIYGGYTGAATSSTGEIYNGTANTWTLAAGPIPNGYGAMQYNRGVTAAFHGSGKLLTNADNMQYPHIYDPAAASAPWTRIETYSYGFYTISSQSNVISAGGKVLMVPVQPQGGSSGAQTMCKLFDFGDKGSLCSQTAECQAGLTCMQDAYDGVSVCCDTACSGACMSCRAVNKASGVGDGVCGPRKTGQQMYGNNGCPYEQQNTCGNDNYECDGVGNCHKWSATTVCANSNCASTESQTDTRYCDGAGKCGSENVTSCSAGYKCQGDASYGYCGTVCYNDVDYCTSTSYCQTWANPYNTCQPKKNDGSTCSYNQECTKGFCVDGVCCENACSGTCMGCSNAVTGQSDGSCKAVKTGTDPRGVCTDDGVASCGQNGACNGSGACQKYASGSTCVTASCATATSRNVADTCNGTGTCTDNGVQNCLAGYACISGVCQTQCTDDANCATNYFCDIPTKTCVADKTSGQACPRDAACSGNSNCVDGVCCNSACTGTCRSCLKNQTGLAADGLCGDITDDTDPANECTIDVAYPTSCKAPGTCNGTGACRVYAKNGVVSAANTCSGSTLTSKTCDGAGNQQVLQTPCYPYKCNAGATACRVACTEGTAAADCDDDSFCQNGVCVGQKPLGTACNAGTECKSGFCADQGIGALEGDVDPGTGEGGASGEPVDQPGVCCDAACGSPCDACKKSIKGQGSDGTCGFVKDHTDPADDCPLDTSNPCGYNGECNGAGACRNVPSGTSCGDTKCVGNSVQGQRCDGAGACVNNDGTTACSPYVCRDVNGAEQCTNPCAADDDCQDGYYCVEQSCKKKLANGATCDTSGICSSGFCVDGVCCDTSCNGQCAACDNAGSEGICSAVKGEPHGNRTKCDHAGEECGGSCDGVNAAACKYVANGTVCGETTCDNGTAKSSECNGQGECRSNKDQPCSPFVCGTDDTCLTLCEQDADCSQGFACDETTQRCLPAAVAAECSEDRLSSVGQNGISTPCKPFLCVPASGTCAVSCAFTTDCAPDFVCEASTKTCLPTPPASEVEEESCACRAVGAAPTRQGYLALALFGLALGGLRRRKRSRNCPARSAKPAGSAQGPNPFE